MGIASDLQLGVRLNGRRQQYEPARKDTRSRRYPGFLPNAQHKRNVISSRVVFQLSAIQVTALSDSGGVGWPGTRMLHCRVGDFLPIHASRSTRTARGPHRHGLAHGVDSRVRRGPA